MIIIRRNPAGAAGVQIVASYGSIATSVDFEGPTLRGGSIYQGEGQNLEKF